MKGWRVTAGCLLDGYLSTRVVGWKERGGWSNWIDWKGEETQARRGWVARAEPELAGGRAGFQGGWGRWRFDRSWMLVGRGVG